MPLFLFINTEWVDGKWLAGQVYSLIYALSNHLLGNYSVPGSVVTIGSTEVKAHYPPEMDNG